MASGKSKKTGTNGGGEAGEDWVEEAESKVNTEEVVSNMHIHILSSHQDTTVRLERPWSPSFR
jgi:hypothetical protein